MGERKERKFDSALASNAATSKRGKSQSELRGTVLTSLRANLSTPRPNFVDSPLLPKSLEMDRQFPPEIVQLVAEASLDPYDPLFFTSVESRQRYSVLKNYCVLNSTWRAVSEPLLFKCVVIQSQESFSSFLGITERSEGTLDGVRDL